jgi:hypothetical protein
MRLSNIDLRVLYLLHKMQFYENHMDNCYLVNKQEYERLKNFYERTNKDYLELTKDWEERHHNFIKRALNKSYENR